MAVYIGDVFMRLGGVSYYTPAFARGGLTISMMFNILAFSNRVSERLQCAFGESSCDRSLARL